MPLIEEKCLSSFGIPSCSAATDTMSVRVCGVRLVGVSEEGSLSASKAGAFDFFDAQARMITKLSRAQRSSQSQHALSSKS